MRKTLSVIIIALLVVALLSGAVFAAQTKYKGFPVVNLILNGKAIAASTPAINIDGTTYVPLRLVSESMGIKTKWDQATQTVIIGSSGGDATQAPTDNLTQTKDNVTVKVAFQMATALETQIKVTVTNNSTDNIRFPASLTQLVAGSTQFDGPKDYDSAFMDDIKPGVVKTGVLKFPALPSDAKSFRVFIKIWDESINEREFEFNVAF